MSHVTTVDLEMKDLPALKAACEKLGLVFHENQKTYRWYGRSVGGYPMPEGFTEKQLGHCEHAIGLANPGSGTSQAYEIGVCKHPSGKGYSLLYDFWQGGFGLMSAVSSDGTTANKLMQEYSTQVAIRQLKRKGYRVKEIRENGKVRLVAR